jgi:hypothetical protein
MDLKVHHDVPMNGPKGPSCVWSKAPICCKKYPAVAGYFMKMEQSSTKRMPQKEGAIFVPGERRTWGMPSIMIVLKTPLILVRLVLDFYLLIMHLFLNTALMINTWSLQMMAVFG